jgi:hypothetical protein
MAEMHLTFNFDGTVRKETSGFSGEACLKKTKFIEEALGTVGKRTMKEEFYEENKETENEKIRNCH